MNPDNKNLYNQTDSPFRKDNFYHREIKRGTEMIDTQKAGFIEAGPNDEKRLATFGIATCTAVAVVADLPNGDRHAYIQHNYESEDNYLYDEPSGVDILTHELDELKAKNASSIKMIIMYPSKFIQKSDQQWGFEPVNEDVVLGLENTAKEKTENRIELVKYPFAEYTEELEKSDKNFENNYFFGTLLVELLPNSQTKIIANGELILFGDN